MRTWLFSLCLCLCSTQVGWAQPRLPLIDEEYDLARLQSHLERLSKALAAHKSPLAEDTKSAWQQLGSLAKTNPTAALEALQKKLDPHCLVGVTINPESRVKATRGELAADLKLQQEQWVLLKVHNQAAVRSALAISSPQQRGQGSDDSAWLELQVLASVELPKTLSGEVLEYVVLRLKAHEVGKREANLKLDVGQGTQDLGFRAEVPIVFTIQAK